jgi:hypothetical protein
MTARPFLPKYVGEAEIAVWIDSDAWVQSATPIMNLIEAALSGAMAIVLEEPGAGFSLPVTLPDGREAMASVNPASCTENVYNSYKDYFSPEIAELIGRLPSYNSGVFALRTSSPHWATWADILRQHLRTPVHKLLEQHALNVAIRRELIPVEIQPIETNFACCQGLPWYDPEAGVLTVPNERHRKIGIVHLTDAKNFSALPVPQFPSKRTAMMPLTYSEFKTWKTKSLVQS